MADLCDQDSWVSTIADMDKSVGVRVIESLQEKEKDEQACRDFWLNKKWTKRKKNSYKLAKLPEKSGWITDILKEKNIKHEEINQIVDDKNIGFWILGYLPDVNEDIVYNLEMGSFLDGKKDGVWRKYQNKKLILESTYRMGNLVEEKKIK